VRHLEVDLFGKLKAAIEKLRFQKAELLKDAEFTKRNGRALESKIADLKKVVEAGVVAKSEMEDQLDDRDEHIKHLEDVTFVLLAFNRVWLSSETAVVWVFLRRPSGSSTVRFVDCQVRCQVRGLY